MLVGNLCKIKSASRETEIIEGIGKVDRGISSGLPQYHVADSRCHSSQSGGDTTDSLTHHQMITCISDRALLSIFRKFERQYDSPKFDTMTPRPV